MRAAISLITASFRVTGVLPWVVKVTFNQFYGRAVCTINTGQKPKFYTFRGDTRYVGCVSVFCPTHRKRKRPFFAGEKAFATARPLL